MFSVMCFFLSETSAYNVRTGKEEMSLRKCTVGYMKEINVYGTEAVTRGVH